MRYRSSKIQSNYERMTLKTQKNKGSQLISTHKTEWVNAPMCVVCLFIDSIQWLRARMELFELFVPLTFINASRFWKGCFVQFSHFIQSSGFCQNLSKKCKHPKQTILFLKRFFYLRTFTFQTTYPFIFRVRPFWVHTENYTRRFFFTIKCCIKTNTSTELIKNIYLHPLLTQLYTALCDFFLFLSCYFRRCLICHLWRAKVLRVVHTLSCIVNFKRQLNCDNHTAHSTRHKKRNEWTNIFTLYEDTLFWFWLYVQQYTRLSLCAWVRAFVCWQLSPSFFLHGRRLQHQYYFGWYSLCANHFEAYSLGNINWNLLSISDSDFIFVQW